MTVKHLLGTKIRCHFLPGTSNRSTIVETLVDDLIRRHMWYVKFEFKYCVNRSIKILIVEKYCQKFIIPSKVHNYLGLIRVNKFEIAVV